MQLKMFADLYARRCMMPRCDQEKRTTAETIRGKAPRGVTDVEGGVGVEPVDDLERRLLGGVMHCTVVGELGVWDALVPILEVWLDQCSKE